jgi:hypothetical protein
MTSVKAKPVKKSQLKHWLAAFPKGRFTCPGVPEAVENVSHEGKVREAEAACRSLSHISVLLRIGKGPVL